ncbi:MAG: ketoacyl-ACP synthase III [Candidatus Abyssobacteria bacterium SURF_17]|jgi:3-oxoacyl-[acyl-carrier-protein] synthase-3|uniref:Beta-ketoacyl-[acyl-carrier-protein] synthase III n=1 Tax=Candidatus Abyssobacteria bacterium SURF_17 TaxID=2093361 RepID=A0A419ETS4_9BACT|nr:MAG: ketoacyl-ACP synthase III [Candidatus Abyssubacteria bacterium SURF_17]
MLRTAILGLGHYLPERVVTNDDLAKMFTTSDEWIQQRTGIVTRRYVDGDVGVSDLAVPAAQRAVEAAGLKMSDIEFIIFATLSPDYQFPGSACLLQDKLGLPGIGALDVRNQCTGFLYGLSIADAFVKTGMYKRILLVGAEVHSSALEFSDRGRDVTVLFGDGAAATVFGPTDEDRGILSTHLHADGRYAKDLWIEIPASCYQPRMTKEHMDEGRHYPRMNGRKVFKMAVETMPQVVHEALAANGLTINDVDLLVPHQANLRINEFVGRELGLPPEKVYHNIQRYGNTTAASIPLALNEAIQEGRAKKGDIIVLAAFGSGFTWASSVLKL